MDAYFFDLDTLLDIDNKVWIVDKNNPSIPIYKISKSDFEIIKSGLYHKQNNKLEFNSKTFFLPHDLMKKLKVLTKKKRIDISNLAFSLQEYLNPTVIDTLNYSINLSNIRFLKNKTPDLYIVCSSKVKGNYDKILKDLYSQLENEGLKFKNIYYISESIYDLSADSIEYNKTKLLLQHSVGYKTDNNKFIDEEIIQYNNIYFYDNDINTLRLSGNINNHFKKILDNTEEGLKTVIKEDIDYKKPVIFINRIYDNEYNKIEEIKVNINYNYFLLKFDSFK